MPSISKKILSIPKDELSLVRKQGLDLEAEGRRIIHMERGEPDFATPRGIIEAIFKAGLDGRTHYPDMQGEEVLRRALAKKITRKNRIPTKPQEVVVTLGGMHGLYCLFQTILQPDDEVLILAPYWLSTGKLIYLSDRGRARFMEFYTRVASNDYSVDLFKADLKRAISPHTKAIYLNTPNNPTGVCLGQDYLQVIADAAIEHDLFVVSDEAYEDIVFDNGRHISIGSLEGIRDRVLTVFTFSKSYAMTGLRLGYVRAPETIARAMVYGPVIYTSNGIPTPIQYGGLQALNAHEADIEIMVRAYEERRDILYKGLTAVNGLNPIRPKGAFYMFVEAGKWGRGLDLVRRFMDAGVAVAPGSAFGAEFDRWVRFSLANSTGEIAEAVDLLTAYFEKSK